MFAKLIVIVLTIGACGVGLLTIRQQRLDVAHEMAMIHRRLAANQENLWRLQCDIAERTDPQRLQEAMQRRQITWVPICTENELAAPTHENARLVSSPPADADQG